MKIGPFLLLILFIGISCKQSDKDAEAAESNIDAARKFIRYALDGKFKDAQRFMIEDSSNMNYLKIAEQFYKKADQETRNGYRASSINIHQITEPIKDSITVVIFSNSFKNDHDTLKVIHANGKWLVDLKYLFEHDMDTSLNHITNKDSLPK